MEACPFCGGKDIFVWDEKSDVNYVQCTNCCASTGVYPTREDAMAAWDKRIKKEDSQ